MKHHFDGILRRIYLPSKKFFINPYLPISVYVKMHLRKRQGFITHIFRSATFNVATCCIEKNNLNQKIKFCRICV